MLRPGDTARPRPPRRFRRRLRGSAWRGRPEHRHTVMLDACSKAGRRRAARSRWRGRDGALGTRAARPRAPDAPCGRPLRTRVAGTRAAALLPGVLVRAERMAPIDLITIAREFGAGGSE